MGHGPSLAAAGNEAQGRTAVTPERWQEVKKVLAAALERRPAERSAYLDQVCAEPLLRREVESLIAAHEQGDSSFIGQPAAESNALKRGTKLGSYEILAPMGAGGMGEVYQAHDTKLKRYVAIKVLPAAFVHDPDRFVRFQREARMLASLNHPNIATIYGLEQSEGVHYLVMELIPGETLAERISKGASPLKEALKVAGQIAEALEAAHEKGVIHRDLKPANVKVTPEGRVKVLDFGLAKAFAGDGGQDLSNAPTLTAMGTEEGGILGTPAYMSPEQARGKPVDKRTDIWAFGCVLYELLTGKRAFRGATLPDTIAAVLEHEPDLQVLPASTPARVRGLLLRCLQKDPQRRLRDLGDARIEIDDLLATLTRRSTENEADLKGMSVAQPGPLIKPRFWRGRSVALGIASVVLALVLAGAAFTIRFAHRGKAIDSVAVLPFVNASGDPNSDYLSDGITESLTNSLSQLPNLKVMSRDSAFRYKGKDVDAKTLGSALGVRAIFKGRVTERGDNLDISAELIDARDDSHIWGQRYSRKPQDIFALQDQIAKEMTVGLGMRLSGEDEKRIAKGYTANPEAYQDYLKGRYWWNKRTGEGLSKGIDYFQQAIAKDPTYALAYDGLADCYNLLPIYANVPTKDAFPKAKEAALKALEIDDTLAEAHASLAWIKKQYDWDWSGGERELQRAIELNPAYATAHLWYGETLIQTGRLEEAITEYKRALELDPLSLVINGSLAGAFYDARQYDQAIEQELKTLELDPNFIPGHIYLGRAYIQKSMYKEGIATFGKALAISPGDPWALSGLGYAYVVAGRRVEGQKVLDNLNALSKKKYVPAWYMATIYAGLGEKDKVFELLERSYEDRSIGAPGLTIKVDPAFDLLRSDPRFADLLRRMNLQP
jgi:eukaryotic-like serine/threonine-protein kinase